MKTGAFIIPTGVGASIGGFAGDASNWARLIAKKTKLIVNPNVVNAACFSGITDDMLYVEGYTLDEFFKGNIFLKESVNNRIGVVFDSAIPKEVLNVHINTINAVKSVYGVNVQEYILTDEPVGVDFYVDESGISTGNVKNLLALKNATEKLLNNGCNAIALVCFFNEEQGSEYANGVGVDPVGGVEAIISHYISKEFRVPCAHAPAFSDIKICTDLVDPRCAAEYITPTFLPCVLLGLNNAPSIELVKSNSNISVETLDFLAIPYDSIGGIPVLEMLKREKLVYAIKENSTVLNVSPKNFIEKCAIIDTYKELLELL